MRVSRWAKCLACLATVTVGLMPAVQAQSAGSFTASQAADGRTAYAEHCASCHLDDLRGAFGPPLAGSDFLSAWGSDGASALFDRVSNTMPPGGEGSLGEATYLDILSYILEVNGHSSGAESLGVDSTLSIDVSRVGAAGDSHDYPTASATVLGVPDTGPVSLINGEVTRFTPVTDAMLRNPPARDWLSWRRTLDGQGYSPLDQVTPDNVEWLRLAWVWTMETGRVQTTPLVHDGVMFLANAGNILQALDAETGDIIWQYRREYPDGRRSNLMRTIAMYEDKIFLTTADASIIAVNARTGNLVWETQKADPEQGFSHSAGPIVAGGVVVSGIGGCGRFTEAGCFITGHDPQTGQELWRRSTVAQPGEPGGDTWGDLPQVLRGGTETWIPGSYDPELGLWLCTSSCAISDSWLRV